MGEGCGVAETAVAPTVSGTVEISAAAPHIIIIVIADAVVATQVYTAVHIRVPLVANLVEIGSIRDRLAMIDILRGRVTALEAIPTVACVSDLLLCDDVAGEEEGTPR